VLIAGIYGVMAFNAASVNGTVLVAAFFVLGMTHLYSKYPFVAENKFHRCSSYDDSIPDEQRYKICMNREKVKTIIVEKNRFNNNSDFLCKSKTLKRVSRNIFLEKNVEVDFCVLKN